MKSKDDYKIRANKLKWQFFKEQEQGKSEQILKEIREQRKFAKKMSKHCQMQYKQLKKKLEYESPMSSDSLDGVSTG
jgi:hypothetical protein